MIKNFRIGMVLAALVGLLAWNSFAAETPVITVKSGTGTKTVMTATSNSMTALVPLNVSNLVVNLTNVNVSTITATGASTLGVVTQGVTVVNGAGTVNGTLTGSNLVSLAGFTGSVTNLSTLSTNIGIYVGGICTNVIRDP